MWIVANKLTQEKYLKLWDTFLKGELFLFFFLEKLAVNNLLLSSCSIKRMLLHNKF